MVEAFERATHLIGTYLESTVSDLGITQAEAHVLAQVAKRGPTAIATLHHEFGRKRSTLTNILDRLEQRKLIRRTLNPTDRRSFVVHLTGSGRRTARRVEAALDDLEEAVAAQVGTEALADVETVARALEAVVRRRSRQGEL